MKENARQQQTLRSLKSLIFLKSADFEGLGRVQPLAHRCRLRGIRVRFKLTEDQREKARSSGAGFVLIVRLGLLGSVAWNAQLKELSIDLPRSLVSLRIRYEGNPSRNSGSSETLFRTRPIQATA